MGKQKINEKYALPEPKSRNCKNYLKNTCNLNWIILVLFKYWELFAFQTKVK